MIPAFVLEQLPLPSELFLYVLFRASGSAPVGANSGKEGAFVADHLSTVFVPAPPYPTRLALVCGRCGTCGGVFLLAVFRGRSHAARPATSAAC